MRKIENPRILVALDFDSIEAVRNFITKLTPNSCRLKVGNILFTRYGPALVEELMQAGFEVFLDLKFHDIPQTVAGACRASADLGVWMVNIHITGGAAMMQAAREALVSCQNKPLLIGVSILTSLTENDINVWARELPLEKLVLKLARLAKENGLDGVVCSSQEAALLRQECGDNFVLVTPGIRLENDEAEDQKRIMTPVQAHQAGSDYLVIGRTITKSKNPEKTLEQINDSLLSIEK